MAEQLALRVSADIATPTVTIDPANTPPVDPEVLVITGASLISFRLTLAASRRYMFALQDPIVVTDPGVQFDPPIRRSDSWVTMLDRHVGGGTVNFEYSINLVDKQGGGPVHIDPTIRNEN